MDRGYPTPTAYCLEHGQMPFSSFFPILPVLTLVIPELPHPKKKKGGEGAGREREEYGKSQKSTLRQTKKQMEL